MRDCSICGGNSRDSIVENSEAGLNSIRDALCENIALGSKNRNIMTNTAVYTNDKELSQRHLTPSRCFLIFQLQLYHEFILDLIRNKMTTNMCHDRSRYVRALINCEHVMRILMTCIN